ncbi:competence-damage inducible [Fusarium pseudocircinatum]|uniref:Competence-damage inducible n=1 Tax=Fusarium pseudocircinatum TaxID=56676 RepID=A0A8H5V032_9HYPO|nr:competence-damage inducible [Fusarium pseudocircinatum]
MATLKHVKRRSETISDIAKDVIRLLKEEKETVGVAESLTGGSIMAALTSVEGASSVCRGGIVSYSTGIKVNILGVSQSIIMKHGAVNGEVAEQMAAGARSITTLDTPTTWGLSTTGVAGPGPEEGKAPGTVVIGISRAGQDRAFGPFYFPGDRDAVRKATVTKALEHLRELLRDRDHMDERS